jgi:hypothetical protein
MPRHGKRKMVDTSTDEWLVDVHSDIESEVSTVGALALGGHQYHDFLEAISDRTYGSIAGPGTILDDVKVDLTEGFNQIERDLGYRHSPPGMGREKPTVVQMLEGLREENASLRKELRSVLQAVSSLAAEVQELTRSVKGPHPPPPPPTRLPQPTAPPSTALGP